MSSGNDTQWALVREVGVEYGDDARSVALRPLNRPIAVARLGDSGYLVVDDLTQRALPLGMRCRTLIFSDAQKVTYDSRADKIDDGYGCKMDADCIAVMDRLTSDINIVSSSGERLKRIDLSSLSERKPWILSYTRNDTFLVTFLNGIQDVDIIEVDHHGSALWHFAGAPNTVGIPSSLQLLPNESILVADEFHHIISELKRDGHSEIRWGQWHHASNKRGCLYSPKWARLIEDGTLLIADTNNHRLVSVSASAKYHEFEIKTAPLVAPTAVEQLENGNLLFCDAGHRCVVEQDLNRVIVWQLGNRLLSKREFSFPRSVQILGHGHYLIADTANNRIIEQNGEYVSERSVAAGMPLFWPRAAWVTKENTLLIADGRNHRVLELSDKDRVLHELSVLHYDNQVIKIYDPHDVRPLPNGNILVVDSSQHFVVETDWDGHVAWILKADEVDIKDPHSAQPLADGRVLITDTRNHRLLFFNPKTRKNESVTKIQIDTRSYKLRLPRYAELTSDGRLLIVDSGNNRLIVTDLRRSFVWDLSKIPDSPIPDLKAPRWAQLIGDNEVCVTDHSNHRMLHLQRVIA